MTIHQPKHAPAAVEPKRSDEPKPRPGTTPRVPNQRLAAALEEAGHIKPRFTSAQELFDALEGKGQD